MNWLHKSAVISGILLSITTTTFLVPEKAISAEVAEARAVELLNQGQTRARQGDLLGAIAAYTQAIAANPRYTEAYINRGLAHHDLGDFRRAIADFEQAVQLDPDSARAVYNRWEVRADTGDFSSALTDMTEAIHLNPNYAEAYNN